MLGTAPLWTRGPCRSISASAALGRYRTEREERAAATAERSRVGAGRLLRARRETARGGPHEQVEDEVEVRSRRWSLGVTEATDRWDCPGGSHNYSRPRKVLEG